MKEAIVHPDAKVEIIDVPIPVPKSDEVLVKVAVSGSNPKDWKVPHWKLLPPHNSGDDIAGTIHAVGDSITEFHAGDRVAAFHVMFAPHGSFAEYAIAPANTTFHIPPSTTFEESSTIPLAAMTAALGLYHDLNLPTPLARVQEGKKLPLLIYGASSAVGAFAVKLAKLSNIHPIIAIAGKGTEFVDSLLDKEKGDIVLDYRIGTEELTKQLQNAVGDRTLHYAFDAIAEHGSTSIIASVLSPTDSNIATVNPVDNPPDGIIISGTKVAAVHSLETDLHERKPLGWKGSKDFGYVFYRLFGRWLESGEFSGHPFEVVERGLNGIEEGLGRLMRGEVSAKKLVFRIVEEV